MYLKHSSPGEGDDVGVTETEMVHGKVHEAEEELSLKSISTKMFK